MVSARVLPDSQDVFCTRRDLCLRIRAGEALYRFLLAQASAAYPEYKIHARGTHTEHKTRTVHAKDQNGNYTTRLEDYTETVTGL